MSDKKTYKLTVGNETGVDTKNGKKHHLELPLKIKKLIDNYFGSEEWKERAKKSFYGECDNNYIFLTKRGTLTIQVKEKTGC